MSSNYKLTLVTEDNVDELLNELELSQIVAIDTETTGLDKWRDLIVGFSLCPLETKHAFYIPIRHELGSLFAGNSNLPAPVIDKIRQAMAARDKSAVWLMWNAPFDYRMLRRDGFGPFSRITDVQVLWHILDERPSNKLSVRAKAIGFDIDEVERKLMRLGGHKAIVNMSPKDMYEYACTDALATAILHEKAILELEKEPELFELAKREVQLTRLIINMEKVGFPVNVEKLKKYADLAQQNMNRLSREISELAGRPINPASSQQVCAVLGIPSSSREALEEVGGDLAKAILEWRAWEKSLSTFYSVMLEKQIDGRIHPTINQTGTETGRWSCQDPNLQALPRENEIYHVRECMEAPDGKMLVLWDYSQMELRVVAHYSGDSAMLSMLANGQDVHQRTAEAIFGPNATKEHRQIAKTINFAMVYGAGAKELSVQLRISEDEARDLLWQYKRTFPNVAAFLRKAQDVAKNRGYIIMWGGRRKRFDKDDEKSHFKAISNLVQGSAAEIVKSAMLKLDPMVRQNGGQILLQVHDEIIVEAPEEKAHEIALAGIPILQDFKLRCPLVVEASIGKCWAQKQKIGDNGGQ